MSFSTEKDFEDSLVFKLTEMENQWSKDVLCYKTEDELIDNWANILFQNNNTTDRLNNCPLTKTEMQNIVNYINKNPYEVNKILNGKYIPIKRDNPNDKLNYNNTIYLFIFDKDDIAAGRSTYQIARQPKFKTHSSVFPNKRGDLMLLINGMPLIHIELKKTGIHVSQAVNQIDKYMKNGVFTGLFSLVQVFVAMNPEETLYFANPGRTKPFNPDYFFHWADFNNKHINDWEEIASTLLSIPMAHRLIGYGTISDDNDKLLKVMRSYQYHAADKIYTRVLGRVWDISDQKGGYIYHTTGSGKTLTSFKCAQLIASSNKVDKIVFLMDRTELWEQTYNKYKSYSDGEDIQDVTNVDSLKTKLQSDDKNQLIVASIQKMSRITEGSNLVTINEIEKIKSKKIVFVIDEAHRDVAGTMLASIKRTYSNAMFFGFTGTPIKDINAKNGITTEGLFGDLLHQYTILEGIKDENVLGFKIFKVSTFDEDDLHKIVARKKSGIEDLSTGTEEQKAEYQKWMMAEMIDIERELPADLYSKGKSSEIHRQKVVENILGKWELLSCRNKFHHILATSSIKEAIAYYDLLKNNDLGLVVTAIFDPHTDNVTSETWKEEGIERILTDYNYLFDRHFDIGEYHKFKKEVCAKLSHTDGYEELEQNPEEAINIVIVVNQLLTGFDSKWINVVYLDKILEYEQYIQTCSRTNRLYGHEKPYGIIKYYRKPNVMEFNAKEALKLYVEHGYENVFSSSLGTNLSNINKCFNDIKSLFLRNGINKFEKLPSSENDKKLFAGLFNNLNLYIERAIPELFSWSQKKYDTDDCGQVIVELDELTYNILQQRYLELPRISGEPGADVPYDIKPYLIEVSSEQINKAFLESKFTEFVKDLSNGLREDENKILLDELRSHFAILSTEEQQIAYRILEDILSGEFKCFDEGKTFQDYINLYNKNIFLSNVKKFSILFGFDKDLILKTMKYHLTEQTINRYRRLDKIMDTLDFDKAKKVLEEKEQTELPNFRVKQKVQKILKEFILSGGMKKVL